MQQLEEYKKKSEKAIKQLEKRRAKIEDSDSPLGKIIDKLIPTSDKLHNGLISTLIVSPLLDTSYVCRVMTMVGCAPA